ncbi:hypothetical protein K443DRAFT_171882 [Laccaria amethystina LaAM-08-1]|uniref:Uncharacterized protein n=1 Tax=Laccaria amethystina LaAM-08-1 TaxID=1095629 RepID=A0A0C9XUD7_9AGAR|nr:hypothetical protein K443DRAFT_171882 [Laccaria amethystina LaAM-08-1]
MKRTEDVKFTTSPKTTPTDNNKYGIVPLTTGMAGNNTQGYDVDQNRLDSGHPANQNSKSLITARFERFSCSGAADVCRGQAWDVRQLEIEISWIWLLVTGTLNCTPNRVVSLGLQCL